MKKLAKRIAALAMTAAMMTASAGAITQDGQSETWFDGVWALIDAFGLKAEHDPYVCRTISINIWKSIRMRCMAC